MPEEKLCPILPHHQHHLPQKGISCNAIQCISAAMKASPNRWIAFLGQRHEQQLVGADHSGHLGQWTAADEFLQVPTYLSRDLHQAVALVWVANYQDKGNPDHREASHDCNMKARYLQWSPVHCQQIWCWHIRTADDAMQQVWLAIQ